MGRNKKYYDILGKVYKTNNCGNITIINFINRYNITVQFEDGFLLKNVRLQHIFSGCVKNPYYPMYCGQGYFGEGQYKAKLNNKITKEYSTWGHMLKRCYSELSHTKHKSYIGSSVCEDWKCFQNFAKWFEENYIEGFHLDKDILVKGNRVYSFNTCCFVPREINLLFSKRKKKKYLIGVYKNGKKFSSALNNKYLGTFDTPEEAFQAYKVVKEQYIKEVADKWRDKITERVYQALYNWKIEITD